MEFILPLPARGSAKSALQMLMDRLVQHCSTNPSTSQGNSRPCSLLYLLAANELSELFTVHFPGSESNAQLNFLQELENSCFPKLFLLYQRFRFFTNHQSKGDKLSKFLSSVEHLANLCDFGEDYERLVRDQIVQGVLCKSLQEDLRLVADLTKKKAKSISRKISPCSKPCCQLQDVKTEDVNTKDEEELVSEPNSLLTGEDSEVSGPEENDIDIPNMQSDSAENSTVRLQPRRKVKMKKKSRRTSKLYRSKRLTKRAVQDSTVDLTNLSSADKLVTLYDRLTDHLNILDYGGQFDDRVIYGIGNEDRDEKVLKSVAASNSKDETILKLITTDVWEGLGDVPLSETRIESLGEGRSVDRSRLDGDGKILTLMDSEKDLLKSLDTCNDTRQAQSSYLFKLPELKDNMSETELDQIFDENLAKVQREESEKKKKKTKSDKFNCTFCDRGFRNRKVYNKHLHAEHRDKHPYKCDLCNAIYMRKRNWILHKQTHGKEKESAICDQCGCVFSDSVKLQRHIYRVHKNSKTYECEICHKQLASKDGLIYHLRVHRSERPYVCDQCGAEHVNQGNLNRHIRWRHQGQRPHKCSYCGKGFVQFTQKVLHQRRYHTHEAPFSCSQCSSSFFSKYDLKVHIRKHTGERPYKCGVCGKDFVIGTHLNRHMQSHKPEKSYCCDLCPSRFSRQANLRGHKKNAHGSSDPSASSVAAPSNVTTPSSYAQVQTDVRAMPPLPMTFASAGYPPPPLDGSREPMSAAAAVYPPHQMAAPPQHGFAPPHPHQHQFDGGHRGGVVASPDGLPGQLDVRPPTFSYPEHQWNRPVWFQPL